MSDRDETNDATCGKCDGTGVVHAHKMGVITPWTEQAEMPGDYYVCPHCNGTGKEP